MLNEIDRDGDIDTWTLDRWSGEVRATRSLKLRAGKEARANLVDAGLGSGGLVRPTAILL
jgi:hypothetical protein